MNGRDTKWFVPTIEKIVNNTIAKALPFELRKGVVSSYSAPNATITLKGDTTSITIVNKSGEVLSNGDRVWVCAMRGDLGNSFVWIRFEPNIT